MEAFEKGESLKDFQNFINKTYGLTDDRLYSIWDLLVQTQRFAMRCLKGIRKGNLEKTRLNLLICFSWAAAIANRLHIDLDGAVWKKFPFLCSYCASAPCRCKEVKPEKKAPVKPDEEKRPRSLAQIQQMFLEIYPPSFRNLEHAGIHLGEEIGEVAEAIHAYLGEHKQEKFFEIEDELADFISCVVGVANSADLNLSEALAKMYESGCHACRSSPCQCTFSSVSKFKS